MATNPQIDTSNIRPEQAEDVARMNNISVNDAYSRISRANASQAGQMQGPEGTYYNPATGERGTAIGEIGKDPNYWGNKSGSMANPQMRQLGTGSGTIGSIYGGSSNRTLDAYSQNLSNMSKPVDEEKIRQDAINRVQSEIDAMNRFYAEKTRQEQGEAKQVGESSLGQNAAINARRGMIGSDFGTARTLNIEQANAKVQNDIYELNNARRLAEQSAIMGRANSAADAQITKKETQLNESLKAAVDLQESLRQRAEKAADTRIAGLIAQGMEPSEADYDALAAQLGIDKETLKAKYAISKPGAEKPIEVSGVLYQKQADGSYKALTPAKDAAKSGLMEVSPGASLYDPLTNKFIGTAPEKPKSGDPSVRDFADGTTREYDPVTNQWKVLAEKKEVDLPGGVSKEVFGRLNTIADNARQDENLKTFAPVRASYETAREAASKGTGASDIVLMRMLAKITDPTTGVKEDEFRTFESAQGKLRELGIKFTSGMVSGDRLTDEGRNQLLEEAKAVYNQRKQAYDASYNFYTDQAIKIGGKADDVVPYYVAPENGQAKTNVSLSDIENIAGISLSESRARDVEKVIAENPDFDAEEVAKSLGFNPVGGDTKPAVTVPSVKKTGMRTDRHNNPTAFTTDIARVAGLREGVDYEQGDSFSNGKYHTARLLGDPVATTIKVIDNIGFYTQGGNQRWTHTAIPKSQWDSLSYEQKKQVVKSMYGHEGGKELKNIFA